MAQLHEYLVWRGRYGDRGGWLRSRNADFNRVDLNFAVYFFDVRNVLGSIHQPRGSHVAVYVPFCYFKLDTTPFQILMMHLENYNVYDLKEIVDKCVYSLKLTNAEDRKLFKGKPKYLLLI